MGIYQEEREDLTVAGLIIVLECEGRNTMLKDVRKCYEAPLAREYYSDVFALVSPCSTS